MNRNISKVVENYTKWLPSGADPGWGGFGAEAPLLSYLNFAWHYAEDCNELRP